MLHTIMTISKSGNDNFKIPSSPSNPLNGQNPHWRRGFEENVLGSILEYINEHMDEANNLAPLLKLN
ncbi:hypothetical protein NQ317_016725 [Molorchus minor]|uniref:Uncharacterized protein n=1 Tax=Molorchus minor TaxID=1323400 RepID=A0ABQ9IYD9_9CUCU|nr:hypothetical protein NQ317_016725 [Molorchus minor]